MYYLIYNISQCSMNLKLFIYHIRSLNKSTPLWLECVNTRSSYHDIRSCNGWRCYNRTATPAREISGSKKWIWYNVKHSCYYLLRTALADNISDLPIKVILWYLMLARPLNSLGPRCLCLKQFLIWTPLSSTGFVQFVLRAPQNFYFAQVWAGGASE